MYLIGVDVKTEKENEPYGAVLRNPHLVRAKHAIPDQGILLNRTHHTQVDLMDLRD